MAPCSNVSEGRRLFDSRQKRPQARMGAKHIVAGKNGHGGDVRFAFEECCLKRFDCAVVLAEADADPRDICSGWPSGRPCQRDAILSSTGPMRTLVFALSI